MKESGVESYLRKRVKELGGEHRKVVYQGRGGSFDDWCFFPGGRLLIVECKRPGKTKIDPLQEEELKFLLKMGFYAVWVANRDAVDIVLKEFFDET